MPYQTRASTLQGFSKLVAQLGGNADTLLSKVGLNTNSLDDPNALISYRSCLELLDLAARTTQVSHFGLLLSQQQDVLILGDLGHAIAEAPTVGNALDKLTHYFHLHKRGATTSYSVDGDFCTWRFDVELPDPPPVSQQLDLALGVGFKILKELLGRDWRPSAIYLQHPKPPLIHQFRKTFKAPVVFDADMSGFVFDKALLDQPVKNSHHQLYQIHCDYLQWLDRQSPLDFLTSARQAIANALYDDQCSLTAVSNRMGMTQRTFQRRLSHENEKFRGLVDSVRGSMAQHYLSTTALPLTRVAQALGYSELAAFSRSFRRRFGVSPRDWRKRLENSTATRAVAKGLVEPTLHTGQ